MRHIVASVVLMVLLPACAHTPMPMAASLPMAPAATVDAESSKKSYKVDEIEGIGPVYQGKLNAVGITNTAGLLTALATRKQRTDVAAKTGISEKLLMSWADKADLMRLGGIGPQMSDLLEAIGINTVPQLAQRVDFDAIHDRMVFANNIAKKFVGAVPPAERVKSWIESARKADRVLEY